MMMDPSDIKTQKKGIVPMVKSTVTNKSSAPTKKPPTYEFTHADNNIIVELKKNYLETLNLDVESQQRMYALEKANESKYHEVFDKRRKILDDIRKNACGDAANIANPLKYFWLQVLKAAYGDFMNEKDEEILKHLVDVRTKVFLEPTVHFRIEFAFEPNEHFSNTVLTKTYYLNCFPDPENPLEFDGSEIHRCEGCKIDWKKPPKNLGQENNGLQFANASFFDYFNPPAICDDPEDPNYDNINAILQNDYELGYYLKERVIPKAILFFTGEAHDCDTPDSSEDDDDDDDSDDDDVDDDDDDVGESSSSDTKKED